MVELGVVQAVEQMDRTGPARCDADTDLTGELRVRTRHERGHLLVPHLSEERVMVFDAIEGAEERVDAVTRVAVDAVNPPLLQAVEHPFGDLHGSRLPMSSFYL